MLDTVLIVALVLEAAAFAVAVLLGRDSWKKLIDHQHEHHHEEWIQSDRPRGGDRTNKELGWWHLGIRGSHNAASWIYRAPDWAHRDPQALAYLSQFRKSYLAGVTVFALLVATALVFLLVTGLINLS